MDEMSRLALAAGDGDKESLAVFVRRSQQDVWRFCASLNGVAEADDLTQETFLHAIRSLPNFVGNSSALTWLLAIARNVAADSVRKKMRRRRLVEVVRSDSKANSEFRECDGPAVEWMEIVKALEPGRRDAFVLTQLIGLDYAEAAMVCGCPVGTIRSRVARARRDLIEQTEWLPESESEAAKVRG